MPNGFWDSYEEMTREESGGGGIVGLTTIQVGFKVYVAGVTQGESFFPVDGKSKDEVKTAAQKFANDHGAARNPQWGIQIRVAKDKAFSAGKPATWKDDRFFNTDAWTDAAKEVVVPSLKKFEISLPWIGWARIGFAPDPNEVKAGVMKDVAQDGTPRYHQRAYITEVFTDEAAAKAAVGSGADTPQSIGQMAMGDAPSAIPEGWDTATWNDAVADVKAQGLNPALSRKYLMDTYAVDLPIGEMVKLLK